MKTSADGSLTCWYALDAVIEAEACEAVAYALMEAGALGTEVSQAGAEYLQVTAYFAALPNRERVRTELSEALRIYNLPSWLLRYLKSREVANEDWLGEWKKSWQPVEVGERFIVAPPWSEIPDNQGRIVIRIEPGMAFGTGTHETTRLCLAAMEKYFDGGSFLDVGTGTGILAIAAAKLFPAARIEACDTDTEAVGIARENAALNGVSRNVVFRVGTIEASKTTSADCVCANLTAETIVTLLSSLLGVTCRRLIVSGILALQAEMVQAKLRECGAPEQFETITEGEWVALIQ